MTTVCRWGRWYVLLPLLLAVGGCGPGVGGTGTGEGYALDFFGARAASVCSASFATELKCPSRIVIGPTRVDLTKGSELVVWVDDPENGQISARIDGSEIDFRSACEGVQFAGTWGTTADGAGRFFGHFTRPGVDIASPGTLTVLTERTGLAYVLSDAQGAVVFGPVILQRAETASTASSCQQPVDDSPLPGATSR